MERNFYINFLIIEHTINVISIFKKQNRVYDSFGQTIHLLNFNILLLNPWVLKIGPNRTSRSDQLNWKPTTVRFEKP